MSEYQYYEFRAVDRPLDQEAKDALRKLSSRAEITSHGMVNTYNHGDFRGRPEELMDRYFDAFLYVANWGMRRLAFRLPKGTIDVDEVRKYCDQADECLSVREAKEHVVVEFQSDLEGETAGPTARPGCPSCCRSAISCSTATFGPSTSAGSRRSGLTAATSPRRVRAKTSNATFAVASPPCRPA